MSKFKTSAFGENVHLLKVTGNVTKIGMFSDLHWDNPKCDRKKLKRDLDYCLNNDIPIHFNGDVFCLMQGKGDRRGNKSDILSEHNNAFYLDSVVDTAIEWFKPYAHLITVVGYGNHETAIIKHQETNVLKRFVEGLNAQCDTNIFAGGYGGWMIVEQQLSKTMKSSTRIKYFHGSGGGGVVTKGAINLTRALELYEAFDVFTMGHIHENSCRNDVRDTVVSKPSGYELEQKQLHLMLTGAYKEEYGTGAKGWHIERGAPIKPIGGRILEIISQQVSINGSQKLVKTIDSYKFPY